MDADIARVAPDPAPPVHEHDFSRLGKAETGIARALAVPGKLALACIAVLAIAGWLHLGLMSFDAPVGGSHQGEHHGHAGHHTHSEHDASASTLRRTVEDAMATAPYVRPLAGARSDPGTGNFLRIAADFGLVLLMWGAMVLAMMLPTAAPMVVTYAQIADTAARKDSPAASPLFLVSGYVAAWIGFAGIAATVQTGLAGAALLDTTMTLASPVLAAAVFVVAGVYQFAPVKHACLSRCQRPFPFFFANWTPHRWGVFRLGLRQGRDCIGCCWAMMAVMFAVGLMNLAWMAGLGVVMLVEKLMSDGRFSRAIGVAFIALGILCAAEPLSRWIPWR